MTRRACIALVLGTLGAFAACGESPPDVTAPAGALHDGGWTMGSGNRQGDSTTTVTTTEQDSTGRGGWTLGSGNLGSADAASHAGAATAFTMELPLRRPGAPAQATSELTYSSTLVYPSPSRSSTASEASLGFSPRALSQLSGIPSASVSTGGVPLRYAG